MKLRSSRPSLVLLLARFAAAGSVAAIALSSVAPAQTSRGTSYASVSGTTPGTYRSMAGLEVSVHINQTLSSKTAAEGDEWDGVLASDLVVHGHLLRPSGSQVIGVVSKAISAGRAHGVGTLEIRLTAIHGVGIDSTPVIRGGVNPALMPNGSPAAAGIPGEANPNANAAAPGDAQNGQALSEAVIRSGSILTFTTE